MSRTLQPFANAVIFIAGAVLVSTGCRSFDNKPTVAAGSSSYLQIFPGQVVTDAVPELALPLPLSAVRLTGGPLKHAQELDAAYLL